MYGTFADSEFLRRNPDGGAVLNHVNSQTAGPFLDVLLQAATLLYSFTGGVYAENGNVIPK